MRNEKKDINVVKSYEDIVDQRLGLGRYQIIVVILLAIVFTADGIEVSALSLILPILKNEWNISQGLQGLLGTILFLGLFCGSLFAGFFIDKFGRKKSLEYISLSQFILGIYSSTLNDVYSFLLIRGLFGFLLGFIIPLIPTLCTETLPTSKRGKITVLVNISFSIGQFLATIIAWFCLKDMTSGNWRLMLIICAVPPIIVFFGSRRFLKESPRYVILYGSVEEGIEILNQIININTDNEPLYKRVFCLDFYKPLKVKEEEKIKSLCNDSNNIKSVGNLNIDKNITINKISDKKLKFSSLKAELGIITECDKENDIESVISHKKIKPKDNFNHSLNIELLCCEKENEIEDEKNNSNSKSNDSFISEINENYESDANPLPDDMNINKDHIINDIPYFNYTNDIEDLKKWRNYVLLNYSEIAYFNKETNDRNHNKCVENELTPPNNLFPEVKKHISKCHTLFNDKYKRFTIGLWTIWFSLNFIKYGLVFILPFFLNAWDKINKEKEIELDGMKSLILTTLGEGFSGVFAYYLVDSPKFGRKRTLFIGLLISTIFILFSYFIPLSYPKILIFGISISRLFLKTAFAVLYPFTAEVYHTSLRTLGVSSSSTIGRIGSSLMPIVSINLFYIDMWLPFLLYFFVGIIGLLGALLLPYDTQGKNLDIIDPLVSSISQRKLINEF